MTPRFALRAIWAVDPTIQDLAFHKNIPWVIRHLQDEIDATIEPVHVLRFASEISADFTARWGPEISSTAEALTNGLIRKLRLQHLEPPHVLFHESLSTRGAVDALADYARRSGAHLIIAQTHGRKGVKRLFLGSFAETLLYHSEVPVMLVGSETTSLHSFRHILYPTDFISDSPAPLNYVLEMAQAFQAKVTLFHSVQHPIEPTGTGFYAEGPYGPFVEYVQRQLKYAHKKAEAAIERARAQGVELDHVIDAKGMSVWPQILKLAKQRKTGLIAMEAQSGPFSSVLLGSTVRQVARHAGCPVWVLKPKARHLAKAITPGRAVPPLKRAA